MDLAKIPILVWRRCLFAVVRWLLSLYNYCHGYDCSISVNHIFAVAVVVLSSLGRRY